MFENFEVKKYGKKTVVKCKTRIIGKKKGVWSKYDWVLMLEHFPETLPEKEIKLDGKEKGIELMCDEDGVFLANVCDDMDSLNSNVSGIMVHNETVKIILSTVVVELQKSQMSPEFLTDTYYVKTIISEESSSLLTRKRKAELQKLESVTKSLRKDQDEDCSSESRKSVIPKSPIPTCSASSVFTQVNNDTSTVEEMAISMSVLDDDISTDNLKTTSVQNPKKSKQSDLDRNLVQRIMIDGLKTEMNRLRTSIYSLKYQQINSDRLEFKTMHSDLELEYLKNLSEQGESLELGDPIIVTEKRSNEKDCYEVVNGVKRAQVLSKGVHRMVNVAVIPESQKDVYVLKKTLFSKTNNHFFNKEKAEIVELLLRFMKVRHEEAIKWKPVVVHEIFEGTFVTSQILKLSVDPQLAPRLQKIIGTSNLSQRDGEKLCSVLTKNPNGLISLLEKAIEDGKSLGTIMESVKKIRPDFSRTLKAKGYLCDTSSIFLKENENHPKMEKFIEDLPHQNPRNTKLITLITKWNNFLLNDEDNIQCVVNCETSVDFEVAIGSNVSDETWKSAKDNDKLIICFSREPEDHSAFFTLVFDKNLIGKKEKGMYQNSVGIFVAKFVNGACLPQIEFCDYCATHDFELASVIPMAAFSTFLGKIGKVYITDDLIDKEISLEIVSGCTLISSCSRDLALYISQKKNVQLTEQISPNDLYQPDAFHPENLAAQSY